MTATRTSGMAIAGFVCSLFCGVVGIVLSVIGYKECSRSQGTVSGQGLALAGIIIGSVVTLLQVIGILAAVAIPAFMDTMKRTKRSEAAMQLNKLTMSAKEAFIVNGEFPRGEAPLTPPTECCADDDAGKRKCGPHPEAWSTPIWQALDFQTDAPGYFRYSYESDGRQFTAKAVGDLDCDGVSVTYEVTGRIVEGNLSIEKIDPAPNSD